MKCVILRNCYVDRLYMRGEVFDVSDKLVKEHPKNFRPEDVPAELYEQATEDDLNEEHEAKMKVANKPEHMPEGHYWCTECQKVHNGNPNKKGKINKVAKKHLKFRAPGEEAPTIEHDQKIKLPTLVCSECGKESKTMLGLKSHLRAHQRAADKVTA